MAAGLQVPETDWDNSRRSIEDRLEAYLSVQPGADAQLPLLSPGTSAFGYAGRVPEIDASELTSGALSQAMRDHGLLIVRNVAEARLCEAYREAIDKVMDAPRSTKKNPLPESQVRSFYHNPPGNLEHFLSDKELTQLRAFHRVSNSCMCIESTGFALQLIKFYEELGLRETIAEYLGEDPCLSAQKWVLRRVPEDVREDGWHQDGSFMGTDIKSLNMWLPLTRCGGQSNAPGMDIVPAPIDRIYSSDDGLYDWSLSTPDVLSWFSQTPPESPEMNPGDALFFDHYSVHRTQYKRQFSAPRYAIETWFFGSRNFPKNQFPLKW